MGKCLRKKRMRLSYRARTSLTIAVSMVGSIASVLSVLGHSLNEWTNCILLSIAIIIASFTVLFLVAYVYIGYRYGDSVSLSIRSMPVEISVGDIFSTAGLKVIGCDTHFDTRVDDVVIAKTSLQGQLVLNHGNVDEIKAAVERRAKSLKLTKNKDGLYDFPLGTIVRYDSSVDNQTYLLLALTEIKNDGGRYKAFTSMYKYEQALCEMWNEIDCVYANNEIVLPILGSGIPKFIGGGKDKENLLRCMLCTLKGSGVDLTSKVKIVIFGDASGIPLYEYKNLFKSIHMGVNNA